VTRVGPTTLQSDHLADTTKTPVVHHLRRFRASAFSGVLRHGLAPAPAPDPRPRLRRGRRRRRARRIRRHPHVTTIT